MAAKTFAGTNGTGPFVASFYSAAVENKPYAELVRRALAGDAAAGAKLSDKPQFVCTGKVGVDDSDTDTVADEIVDLVDQGVSFAANTVRKIRLKCYMHDDDNLYFEETEQYVYCSPAGAEQMLGDQKLVNGAATLVTGTSLTNQAFGLVYDQGAIATGATTDDASPGLALGGLDSDGIDVLTIPACRKVQILEASSMQTTVAATTGKGVINVTRALAAGTNIPAGVATSIATDDGAAAVPADGTFDIALNLWPPAHAEVVITSGQPSVNVSLPDLSLGDRITSWIVEVYVGRATGTIGVPLPVPSSEASKP